MYIVRWLMGHPIIATWVLGLIAILLSVDATNKSAHNTEDMGISHTLESVQTEEHAKEHVTAGTTVEAAATKEDAAKGGVAKENVAKENATTGTTANGDSSVNSETALNTVISTAATTSGEKSNENKFGSEHTSTSATKNNVASGITEATTVLKETVTESVRKTADKTADKVNTMVSAVKKNSDKVITKSEAVVSDVKNAIKTKINPKSQQDVAIAGSANLLQLKKEVAQVPPEASSDLEQVKPAELLLMAREAYWNNGLDEAAELYLRLIKLEPDVIEHKGELGNVYWRQGYPRKAAELYSEIALPMIKNGNTDRVVNMVGFIALFFPEKAAEIQQQIQQQ